MFRVARQSRRANRATRDPEARISSDVLSRAAAVIKCLGHPLRLLEALEAGEQSVSDLQAYADAPQPVVSQQLAVLRAHDVVDVRREGHYAYYRVVEPKVASILECIRVSGCDGVLRVEGSPASAG